MSHRERGSEREGQALGLGGHREYRDTARTYSLFPYVHGDLQNSLVIPSHD